MGTVATAFSRGLTHANPAVRVIVAWGTGVFVLLAAWQISYGWLPEGVLGWSLASQLPLSALRDETPLTAGIFSWNLLVGGIAVLMASFFRVGKMPLAYVAPWAWFALYGIALGTNSFAITTPGARIAPQLEIAWTHVGLREVSAYLLGAAALADRHLWMQRSWWDWRISRVRFWSELRLTPSEGLLLAAAVLLLASSAAAEAAQIAAILR